jgi:DNA-binding IclR family transcriptional regulator
MDIKNHRMLEKAMLILEYISDQREGSQLTDICTVFSMPKSSGHSLLNTLANMGYLQKDDRNRYSIGIKTFEVGSKFIDNNDFYAYSRDVLRELVSAAEETAHMAVLEETDIVYLSKYDSSHVIRMVSSVGKRVPAHATALGKALLSGKKDDEIRSLYRDRGLVKLTANTITMLPILLEQLEETRRTGFATEREESTIGVQCVAVPIKNKTGETTMSISISVPVARWNNGFEIFKAPLLEAKRKMEVIL